MYALNHQYDIICVNKTRLNNTVNNFEVELNKYDLVRKDRNRHGGGVAMFIQSTINNGNCTEWSAIWSEIKRVITKSHDREAEGRFVITSLISDQNCTTRSAISTLLHSF